MTTLTLTPQKVMSASPIIPVVNINDSVACVELAHALVENGIKVIEITLRNKSALESIEKVATSGVDILVGAGTVASSSDLAQVANSGAQFAISPGMTPELLHAARTSTIPLIPGISSASDIMLALSYGITHLKFFPAEQSGGVSLLKALSGPFSEVTFCPTGGIGKHNFLDYLALPNVACVGGSWIVPNDSTDTGFASIKAPIEEALTLLKA